MLETELEVVPENAIPVLYKEQVDSKAKKADWRRRSGRGAGGGRNEWSKIPKLVGNGNGNENRNGNEGL